MNIVGIIHVLIYLFMIFGLLSSNLSIIWTHIIMSFTLLLHWVMNDNKCILTELECYVMETTEDKTMTRQLLDPLLNQSSDAVVVGTLLGLTLSVCKLYWFCACPVDKLQ